MSKIYVFNDQEFIVTKPSKYTLEVKRGEITGTLTYRESDRKTKLDLAGKSYQHESAKNALNACCRIILEELDSRGSIDALYDSLDDGASGSES